MHGEIYIILWAWADITCHILSSNISEQEFGAVSCNVIPTDSNHSNVSTLSKDPCNNQSVKATNPRVVTWL